MLGELGKLSCLETRYGAFSSTFRRRILRGGYIAWRIRSRSLEGPAGWSFDPSAEGAMTTARSPLSLSSVLVSPLLSTDYGLSPCCHTLRHRSLTVRTLCLRREEWGHDPPAVTTRNPYWRLTAVDLSTACRFVVWRCRLRKTSRSTWSTSTLRQRTRIRLVQYVETPSAFQKQSLEGRRGFDIFPRHVGPGTWYPHHPPVLVVIELELHENSKAMEPRTKGNNTSSRYTNLQRRFA